MAKINCANHGNIAVIHLDNGAANAIDPELVLEFAIALQEVKREAAGLILKGGEKVFSLGLALPTLISFDRPQMTRFLYSFDDLVSELYSLPLPTACALQGHAVAGGHILASACDLRLADNDKKKTGLNEIRLGVPVPYLADQILKQIVGERMAMHLLYSGDFIAFAEAEKIGLIDEIVAAAELESRCLARLQGLADLPAPAFAAVKNQRTAEIIRRQREFGRRQTEVFLDCWFTPATHERLEDAARKF